MAKTKRRFAPAKTLEGRENQLISLAVDLAEQQLLDGTASAQVITHYLKLGSMREKLEMERIKSSIRLEKAKADAIASSGKIEELFHEAMEAFKGYSGELHEEA